MEEMVRMDRRALMQQVALLIGAASIPAEAFAATAAKRKPAAARFLSPAQYATFSAIADTIIPVTDTPGALAAGVPKLFDGLLRNWASAESKAELTGVIDAIAKLGGGFSALPPAKRKALLLEYDKEAVKIGPPSKKKNVLAFMFGPPAANPAYVQLKSMVINLYYASEIACTKELVYEHVPGKFVASLKVTPETRPFAGLGGLFG